METKRLFDFLALQVKDQPAVNFLSAKEITPAGKVWKDYTFADTQNFANRVSQLMLNLGLKKDDKIAIIAANRPEWNFVDLGSLQLGVVDVPMYPTLPNRTKFAQAKGVIDSSKNADRLFTRVYDGLQKAKNAFCGCLRRRR